MRIHTGFHCICVLAAAGREATDQDLQSASKPRVAHTQAQQVIVLFSENHLKLNVV